MTTLIDVHAATPPAAVTPELAAVSRADELARARLRSRPACLLASFAGLPTSPRKRCSTITSLHLDVMVADVVFAMGRRITLVRS